MSSLHNPLNFFTVILPINLQEGKLPLPKGFGRKYGKTLSNMVLIKLPNGVGWKMNWTKHEGQIWLDNGWKVFVKFYSISVGYFLVFKYEGNSHFQVLILDTSFLEITYPVLHGTDDDEGKKDDSVEVILECNKARPKSPVPCPRPHKKARTNPVVEEACSDHHMKTKSSRIERTKLEKTETHLDIDAAKKGFKGNGGGSFNSGKHSKSEATKSKEPLSFKKPFSFDVKMYPTYLTTSCLYFPCYSGMNYVSKNEGTLILQVSDGKTWPVSYKFGSGRGRLTNGWLSFVTANNLKEGDVCTFKMIESGGVSVIVSIRRANKVSTTPLSQGGRATNKPSLTCYEQFPLSMHAKSEAQKAPCQFKSYSRFTIFMRSCLLKNTKPSIPIDFIRRYIRRNEQYVTLQVGRRSCLVKLVYYPKNSYAKFSTGWSSFVRECDLKARDFCHFQLIDEDEDKLVLKVSVEKDLHSGA